MKICEWKYAREENNNTATRMLHRKGLLVSTQTLLVRAHIDGSRFTPTHHRQNKHTGEEPRVEENTLEKRRENLQLKGKEEKSGLNSEVNQG